MSKGLWWGGTATLRMRTHHILEGGWDKPGKNLKGPQNEWLPMQFVYMLSVPMCTPYSQAVLGVSRPLHDHLAPCVVNCPPSFLKLSNLGVGWSHQISMCLIVHPKLRPWYWLSKVRLWPWPQKVKYAIPKSGRA